MTEQSILTEQFITWCVEQHEAINLPYKFHLMLVDKVAKQFKNVWDTTKFKLSDVNTPFFIIRMACAAHDLIEDVPTRVNYNSLKKKALECLSIDTKLVYAESIAEITRAVTNYGRGRNRDERMPDFVYEDIKNTPGATFVKLCDRIANVEYGILTTSNMVLKYKKEHQNFKDKLYHEDYKLMFDYLEEEFLKVV